MIEPQTNAEPARKIWVPAEPVTNPLVKAYFRSRRRHSS
jgi:hypothetical protein